MPFGVQSTPRHRHPLPCPARGKLWGEDGLTSKRMEIRGGSAGKKASDKPPIKFLVPHTNAALVLSFFVHLPRGLPSGEAGATCSSETGLGVGGRAWCLAHSSSGPHDTGSAGGGKKIKIGWTAYPLGNTNGLMKIA
jgi:hypothetical protein